MAEPYGVAIDPRNNDIYVADTRNNVIRKVTVADGKIWTYAGSGTAGFSGDGAGAKLAQLNQPTGVAVDAAGNLYIVDQLNHRIRKVALSSDTTAGGTITTIAGDGNPAQWADSDGKPATSAHLCAPYDIAFDGTGANLYITDTGNMAVRKVTMSTGIITTFAGTGVALCGQPGGFNGESGTATAVSLDNPNGIAVDASGNVYIADTWNNRVRQVTPGGSLSTIVNVGGLTTSKNGAQPVLNPDGTPKTNSGYNGDNQPATKATLNWPYGVAIDPAGNLLISDYHNYRIRKVAGAAGTNNITTVAGNGRSGYDGDGGDSTLAYISDPANVNVDRSGNFYIVDQASNRIREVYPTPPPNPAPQVTQNPSNVFTTPVGAATFQASASGTPTPTVQWQVSTDGVTFTDLPGQTGNIISFTAQTSDSGKKYRAVFTNTGGRAITSAATLTVRPAPRPPTDLDGDGKADLTVWRPGDGTWYTLTSSSGFSYAAQMAHQWGNQSNGDIPLMGDLDGDHIADLVIWRASTGTWYWLLSSQGYNPAAAGAKQWGNNSLGDVPMLADLDGDGKMDLVLWRRSDGTWYWLTSSTNYDYNQYHAKQWGNQSLGDVPKLADIDGDGKAELIVWRASTGTWYWLTSTSGYDYNAMAGKQWGSQSLGDVPFTGDIDGDGKTELVVWRASTGTWYWLTSTTGYAGMNGLQWGSQAQGDVPLLTDLDGDGKADLTVWRAPTGTWFWLKSTTGYDYNQAGARQWGSQANGDIPIVK